MNVPAATPWMSTDASSPPQLGTIPIVMPTYMPTGIMALRVSESLRTLVMRKCCLARLMPMAKATNTSCRRTPMNRLVSWWTFSCSPRARPSNTEWMLRAASSNRQRTPMLSSAMSKRCE
ncbi:hypothetical protein NP493_517g00024 [Ridgeia piscesae]|uniref:Uncharacterized protein n=1 Tax=Ridgeia piscesae TaxID=27915 RepID=A0AAD9NSF9_RIDPI|nr:hypothetical protein NP493_517g00024 [Ridgeia piscesae]